MEYTRFFIVSDSHIPTPSRLFLYIGNCPKSLPDFASLTGLDAIRDSNRKQARRESQIEHQNKASSGDGRAFDLPPVSKLDNTA